MVVNDLNREYNLIKVICIREYKDYRIGDMFMVLDFGDEYGYIMNMIVYPKSHFIPFSEYRKERIDGLLKRIND